MTARLGAIWPRRTPSYRATLTYALRRVRPPGRLVWTSFRCTASATISSSEKRRRPFPQSRHSLTFFSAPLCAANSKSLQATTRPKPAHLSLNTVNDEASERERRDDMITASLRHLTIVTLLILAFAGHGLAGELIVAAASDLNFPIKEIIRQFEQRTGNTV